MAKATKRRVRDEEDEIYERPRPKKGKPPHPRAYSEDADDAEEDDPGHLESQEFLKTTKTQAKKQAAAQPNGNLTSFQKVVEMRRMELGKLLQDKAREVQEHDAQLRDSLISALRDGFVGEAPLHVGLAGQDGGPNPLLQKATALITASKALLHSYSSLSEHVASAAGTLTKPQEADAEYTKLETLIGSRGKWVGSQVLRRLSARSEGSHDSQPSPASCEIWTRFGGGMVGGEGEREGVEDEGEAWAKAVKQARRGVRRLVRGLPDEEGGVERERGKVGGR